ncbi:MAG: methyltransferase, partial [Saprospiraceae bacterium]|nr:methyltransferase [Saprospiraceae bacterium]
ATICMARGLAKEGVVHTIEINPELDYIAKKYFELAGLQEKIRTHIGDAKEIIPKLDMQIDFAFVDGAKPDYSVMYEMIKPKLRLGGFLAVDNVLWSGKVAMGAEDKLTRSMHEFTKKVSEDKEVEMIILPGRDGLMLVRKIADC